MNSTGELRQVFNKLKSELAVRENNNHIGSGLGGDATVLNFLIARDVKLNWSKDNEIHISDDHKNLTIELNRDYYQTLPTDSDGKAYIDLKPLREKLKQYCNDHSLDAQAVTFEQISNLSWLKDQNNKSLDWSLLVRSTSEAVALRSRLEDKIALQDRIDKMFSAERARIEKEFLVDAGLPDSTFTTLESEARRRDSDDHARGGELRRMLNKHPVFGQKLINSNDRYGKMSKELLHQEDIDAIKLLNGCPGFARVLAFRLHFGIEVMVKLNLDEHFDNPLSEKNE